MQSKQKEGPNQGNQGQRDDPTLAEEDSDEHDRPQDEHQGHHAARLSVGTPSLAQTDEVTGEIGDSR